MFKEKPVLYCKECKGNGFVKGTQSSAQGLCIFCHGSGHTGHGPREHDLNLVSVMKWCEDYIDGKKDGWYH